MDKDETSILEMFIRVHGFAAAHAGLFPAASHVGELFAAIGDIIAELRSHAASQSSTARSSKEGTTRKGVVLAALQDDLEAMSRTARAIAITTPGLDDKFRLPHNVGAEKLIAAARASALDAEPMKAEFIKRGLPASFLDDLNAKIAEAEQLIESRDQQAGASVAATAAVDDVVTRGMKAVRELDAIVRNICRDDPAALAEWTSARHVERAPRRSAPENPPTTQPAQ
jgi:hypothetical protein